MKEKNYIVDGNFYTTLSAFAEKVNMKIPQLRKICPQMRTKVT